MKIAVTGATGFVGSHIVEALAARGHDLTILARDPKRLRWISHLPLRVIYGDMEAPRALSELVARQDVIVHAAGITRARALAEFVRVNVEGSLRMLETARRCNPGLRRFLYVSSQAAVGPSPDGVPLDEEAEHRPVSPYGESKAMAECELRRSGGDLQITVVRPPSVFGPRDRDIYAYFRLVAAGIEPVPSWENAMSVVYVKNLAHGLALAAESTLPGWRVYSFADNGRSTLSELVTMIARAIGRRTVKVRIPGAIVAAIAEAAELIALLSGRPPLFGRSRANDMRQPFWLVSDRRAREELGYRPLMSTAQGIAETASWYRQEGWL